MNRSIKTLVLAVLLTLGVRQADAGLPLTQSTTYVASSTPAIKAQDLNDLQKYLAGIFSAVYTVKALVVDGTGGASVTGTPGTVRVSSTVSTYTSTPPFTMPTVPIGQLNREQVLLGAVHCLTNPAMTSTIVYCGGFNIGSVTRMSTGAFRVAFNNAFPNATNHVPQLTAEYRGGYTVTSLISAETTFAGYTVQLYFVDSAGVPRDPDGFNLTVVGG